MENTFKIVVYEGDKFEIPLDLVDVFEYQSNDISCEEEFTEEWKDALFLFLDTFKRFLVK